MTFESLLESHEHVQGVFCTDVYNTDLISKSILSEISNRPTPWTLEMTGKRQKQLPAEEHVASDWWKDKVDMT